MITHTWRGKPLFEILFNVGCLGVYEVWIMPRDYILTMRMFAGIRWLWPIDMLTPNYMCT